MTARALAHQLDRGVEQKQPEQIEHPAELRDGRSADGDEDATQNQRDHDANQQRLLLVGARHRELGHDDQKDEEIIDRQALLGDETREILGAMLRPPDPPETAAEDHRQGDEEDRPPGRLLEGGIVGLTHMGVEIEDEQCGNAGDSRQPDPDGYVHRETSGRR